MNKQKVMLSGVGLYPRRDTESSHILSVERDWVEYFTCIVITNYKENSVVNRENWQLASVKISNAKGLRLGAGSLCFSSVSSFGQSLPCKNKGNYIKISFVRQKSLALKIVCK